MRKPVFAITLAALLWGPVALAAAEEPPYLDYVHGLRASGLADLALEYLLKLAKKPPPGVARVLPLELAETRLDLARLPGNESRRDSLYNQAKDELEAFLKTNADSLLGVR